MDTHLNAWWQKHYARLFSGVTVTQAHWTAPFSEQGIAVGVNTWWGHKRSFKPFADRTQPMTFVGRLTEARPVRTWQTQFLNDCFPLRVESTLPFAEVLDLYDDTCLVPNESIFGEVNMRLFEASSCGCLVLGQDIGSSQNALYEPGREIVICRDALELKDKAGYYLKHPQQAQTIARRAWERTQAEHLPEHRAGQLMDFVGTLGVTSVSCDPELDLALTMAELWLTDRISINPNIFLSTLGRYIRSNGLALALVLRTYFMLQQYPQGIELLQRVLHEKQLGTDLLANQSASVFAMLAGQFDMAKLFYFRQQKGGKIQMPEDSYSLHIAWARLLIRHGEISRPGAGFNHERHLPSCAVDHLIAAKNIDVERPEALKLLESHTRNAQGSEVMRISSLSMLSMLEKNNWRWGLRLGLTNLQAYRAKQGLEELLHARQQAQSAGQDDVFLRMLRNEDPSGLALRAVVAG